MRTHCRQIIFILMLLIFMSICMDVRVSTADYEKTPVLVAYLSGSQQTPEIKDTAQGRVTFYLSSDGKELYFKLYVTQIENIQAAHIHMTSGGRDGRAVAALFDFHAYPRKGSFDGAVSEGVLTAADLIGPLVGSPFSTLLREMEQGETYVNVSTRESPNGYVRGQIVDPYDFQH